VRDAGFTLTEVLITMAIIATLAAIAIPNYMGALRKAMITRVMSDLHYIDRQVTLWHSDHGHYPDSLAEVLRVPMKDAWGSPYQYLRIAGVDPPPRGKWRKDRFLVPINSDFDLYSMGPDRRSRPPLTAKHSRDDIIRAADGAFFGTAADY